MNFTALLRMAKARGPASSGVSTSKPDKSTPVSPSRLTLSPEEYMTITLQEAVSKLGKVNSVLAKPSAQDSSSSLESYQVSKTKVGTALYIPDFVTPEEEEAIIALSNAAPASKWVHLRARSLQMWGGTVTESGLMEEEMPQWYWDIIDKVVQSGIVFPPYPAPDGSSSSQPTPTFVATSPLRGCTEEQKQGKVCKESNTAAPDGDTKVDVLPQPPSSHPRANHVLLNRYQSGEGIMPHTDGPAYSPKAVVLSLGASTVLAFWDSLAASKKGVDEAVLSLLLRPRSLVTFADDLYSRLFHGIEELTSDVIADNCANADAAGVQRGDVVTRAGTRLSLTMRYVRPKRDVATPTATSSPQESDPEEANYEYT